ncbi:MAG: chemotaxis protein CheW [Pseudomonadota bacterium]|nr:chemotaxis protein CheW [Pseudomonadota bacterium]
MDLTPPPQASRPDAAERRSRLRQYQVQLLARMQAARTGTGARVNQLGVAIGEERYLLDLTAAGEIVSVAPVTAVPLTQAWYLGLANIRGSLVGVIDLARYLGQGETSIGTEARFVTFAPGLGMNCALLVTRVYGLRHAADMRQDGERLRDSDDQAWTPLDLAALVRDERFLQVGL